MFFRKKPFNICKVALLLCLLNGCGTPRHLIEFESDISKYRGLVDTVQYQNVNDPDGVTQIQDLDQPPATVDDQPREPYYMSVEEAVMSALTNSRILRDLGGRLVRAPEAVRTIVDPAIVETDPITGIEASLSAYDAVFASSLFAEKNDFAANNLFQLQGADTFQQDFSTFQVELSKASSSGTEFAIRQNFEYDANNSPANLFPSAWNTNIEAEVRQPLLQGRGVAFNQIAGPNGTIKNFNGVLLARLNTDMSQLEFEIAVRDMVNNVENAYWDLYYAYRFLESRIAARDAAMDTWKKVSAREGLQNSTNVLNEQASEQYWEFEEEVVNAKSGRVIDGTRSNNGSHGGTFNGNVGVQVAERSLRLLIGWPINDSKEIRPKEDPAVAEVLFDWSEIAREAVANRAEIRRQELLLKRHGLELAATRNFLLQRVDLVGLYRFRGFGKQLLGSNRDGIDRFDNAYADLTSGDFQEWRIGIETALPIGFRQAHAAVRQAQLKYSREQSILDELSREVLTNLSNEYGNIRRAYKAMQLNFNRRFAAKKRLAILLDREGSFGVDLSDMLYAQRRAANADSQFFKSLIEYVIAIKNVHFEKGSLLRYNNVFLTDVNPSEKLEQRRTSISTPMSIMRGDAPNDFPPPNIAPTNIAPSNIAPIVDSPPRNIKSEILPNSSLNNAPRPDVKSQNDELPKTGELNPPVPTGAESTRTPTINAAPKTGAIQRDRRSSPRHTNFNFSPSEKALGGSGFQQSSTSKAVFKTPVAR
ncbi:TolC family protein [Pirellulaceae bacterium]|nr:TolC family protein [Pirellulaceae bacterium]